MLENLPKCRCAECPFSDGDGKPIPEREVPAHEVKRPKLTIVSEYPRSNDTGKETAMDGQTGVFVREALRRSGTGLKPRDVTVVNAIRCWAINPSKPDLAKAAKACAPRLTLPPGPKLAMGRHALYAAAREGEYDKKLGARLPGTDFWVTNSVLEMFAQPHYRTALAIHINRALEPDVPAPKVVIDDGPEMREALRKLIGKEISVDIETAGTNPFHAPILCIGVGTADVVCSVPWHVGSATPQCAPETQNLLADVLRKATCLVAHNGAHDFSALESRGFKLAKERFDTFIAHGVAASELLHRLQYVAGLEFPVHGWKGAFLDSANPDAKGLAKFTERPIEELQRYNAEDVAYTARLKAPLERRLYDAPHDGWKHYKYRSDLNDVLCLMTKKGMPFNERARAELDTWVNYDAMRYKEKFESLAGGIDAGKDGGTAAVKDFFFKTLGAPVLARTDADAPSLSKNVLKRYTQECKGTTIAEAARSLLKFKLYGKLHSTFTGPGCLDVYDGWVHPSFNAVGTVSGRLSCSGPNLQQMPLYGRKMFRAPEGWCFVEADLAQVEPRLTAELSADPAFIDVFAQGKDIYLRVASALFNVREDEVTKSQRQIAKMALLANNYGTGAKTFREQLANRGVHVSEPEAAVFLKNLKRGFPVMAKWQRCLIEKARETRYVEEPYGGWRRYFYNKNAVEDPKVKNFPLQAAAAELMRQMLLDLANAVDWKNEFIVCQIHDSVTLLVQESRADKWLDKLPKIMYRKLEHVELKSDAKASKEWYDVK